MLLHGEILCFERHLGRQEQLPATSHDFYGDESLIYDDNGDMSSDLLSRSHEIPMSVMEEKGETDNPDYIRAMKRVDFAIYHINRQRKGHGEQYCLHEVVKVLEVKEYSLMILTFNVRDVSTDAMKEIEASVWAYDENFLCNLVVWRFIATPPLSPISPPSSPETPHSPLETLSQQYSAMGITPPPQQQNFMGLIDAQISEWKRMGYDFNSNAPDTPDTPFNVVSKSKIKKCTSVNNVVMGRINMALDEINAQAQVKGQMYELKKIVKVVNVVDTGYFAILAFNVKEVNTGVVRRVEVMVTRDCGWDMIKEWRFK